MKKVLLVLFTLLSYAVNAQKSELIYIPDLVSNIIKEHVTFVSWETYNDTIKIKQLIIWDRKNKRYVDYSINEIEKKYPLLFRGLTSKTDCPTSFTVRGNVYNFYSVNPVDFIDYGGVQISTWQYF
jgi:hypothetical protein